MNASKKGLIVPFSMLIFLNCSLVLNAQMLVDFETPATSPQFTAEGVTAVVANPDKTGLNPSDSVGYYNKIEGNWHYVSLHFPDTVKIRHNNTLTFKLRTSTQGRIFAKFYNGSNVVIEHWAPDWNFQPSPNAWTECTMDMTDAMGKQFTMLQLAACVDNNAEADVWSPAGPTQRTCLQPVLPPGSWRRWTPLKPLTICNTTSTLRKAHC